jgi:hypothetical protein
MNAVSRFLKHNTPIYSGSLEAYSFPSIKAPWSANYLSPSTRSIPRELKSQVDRPFNHPGDMEMKTIRGHECRLYTTLSHCWGTGQPISPNHAI